MSSIKIVENVTNKSNGKKVHALEFVRKHRPLAAMVSKATAGVEPVTRDATGNRKIAAPDNTILNSVHRSIMRRNQDAKMTLQMLPDLKLAVEMIVSLIMSPKDMYNDDIQIKSESSDLLPASLMSGMMLIVNTYYKKNHDLSEFFQSMLMEVLALQGGLPVAIIPENAIDDLINNYNSNMTLEAFRSEYDLERYIPHPANLLGVPDYLSADNNKRARSAGSLKLGPRVSFDLQSFEAHRPSREKPTPMNAGIAYSKLLGKPDDPWVYKDDNGIDRNADEMVFVTDNINVLKMPQVSTASMESRVDQVLRKKGFNRMQATLETMAQTFKDKQKMKTLAGEDRDVTDAEVESMLFKNRRFAYTPVAALKTNVQLKRNSIGEAMIRIFDSSCFMPVSEHGDPSKKMGGYVLLDENGYPLTSTSSEAHEIMDLSNYAGGNGNFVSSMNDRSNQMLNGKSCDGLTGHMLRQFFTRTMAEMTEKDVIDRVKNGQYTSGAQIGSNDDFYWLMMTRMLKGSRTQMLWIPAEFLVYFAMDYDELGFGKSLLDDIRNITSMRIMLLVSGIAASLKNSIGRTKVTIKLEEHDPDANKTLEDIQDEILKSRMNPIPFGVNNVADISKYLQRSCYEFEISGSTAVPDMQVSFDQYQSQYPKPDQELQDQLKDLSIQHFGLTRDMIDAGDSVDFAIQAATNNMLTMKRIMRLQRKIAPHGSQYVRKISANSESQLTAMRELLYKNFESFQVEKLRKYFSVKDDSLFKDEDFKKLIVEQCVNTFINNLYIELPSPSSTTLATQKEAFSEYAEFVKEALEYIFNESFFDTSLQGEGLADHVEMIKNIYLSHYMREYMSKNSVLPELSEITTIGEDGKVGLNIADALEKHIKALGMTTGNFFARFHEFSIKQTKLMAAVPDSSTEGVTDTGGGDGGGGGGSSSTGDPFLDDSEFNPDADLDAAKTDEPDGNTTTPDGDTDDGA